MSNTFGAAFPVPAQHHAASTPISHEQARSRFPSGLYQPPGSFRFSADALLLACFPELAPGMRALDLGTGCGVAAFSLFFRMPDLYVTGVEMQPELILAAARNACSLGFGDRFIAILRDLAVPGVFSMRTDESLPGDVLRIPMPSASHYDGAPAPAFPENGNRHVTAALAPQSFDLVLANPPYRQRHTGRLPRNPSRLVALFELPETLLVFCRAAATALKEGGLFVLAYPAERLEHAIATLKTFGLTPARILFLCSRAGSPPWLTLIEAVKSGHDGRVLTVLTKSLALHQGSSANTRFTDTALAFCPFLARHAKSTPSL